jgi:hypothetical protein
MRPRPSKAGNFLEAALRVTAEQWPRDDCGGAAAEPRLEESDAFGVTLFPIIVPLLGCEAIARTVTSLRE